jgi:outer membrane protein, heavy metal efflux system
MSEIMKHAACYLLLVIFAGFGCAQSRSVTRSETNATPSTTASNSEQTEFVPAETSIGHFVSDTDSAGRDAATLREWSGGKSTAMPNASTDGASFDIPNAIQPVSHQQSASVDAGAADPDSQLSALDSLPTTTLDSLEQLALSSNPTLTELQARVDAANGRWLQVGLKPNPVASLSIQEIGNENSAGQYGALVGQEFVTANKLGLNRNAAAWRVKQAEQELAAQRLRVLTDVRRGFYAVLVAQERVKVAEELHGIAQQSVEKAKELIKFQEPATVLTQAEIEAELAAVLVDNSRTQQEANWRLLAAAIGQPDFPRQNVDGQLTAEAPKLVWDHTLDRLRRESPEIAAAAAEVEQSRWALERATVQSTPNVTLQAGVAYDDSSNDPFGMLQVSLPLPIYNWNQGGIAEAQANVMAAEQSVQRVELNLQQRLAAVYQQYDQSRKQALRYETTILQKARKNLDLNRQSYSSGQSSYLAVLTAQRSYSQAQLSWLNAIDQLWSATVQMEGLLLSNSLQ